MVLGGPSGGWEFIELGRLWQILIFVGLISWLIIVYRAVAHHPYLGHNDGINSSIIFYILSAILVVALFGFGLMYGKGSHLITADYWGWFVVHIWVESIFEFFGIAVVSLILVAMGLAPARAALMVAYFTAIIVFLSGILGTAHHYFWFGVGLCLHGACALVRLGGAGDPEISVDYQTGKRVSLQVALVFPGGLFFLEFHGRSRLWFPHQPTPDQLL